MLILWENESENGAEYAFHPPRSVVTIFKFNGGALQALTCRPSPVESLFDRYEQTHRRRCIGSICVDHAPQGHHI